MPNEAQAEHERAYQEEELDMRRLLVALGLVLLTACGRSPAATTAAPTSPSRIGTATAQPAVTSASATGSSPPTPTGEAPTAHPAATSAASAPTVAGPAATGTAAAAGPTWPTYHHSLRRRGVDPATVAITNVRSLWQTTTLDGQIYAEPLVVGSHVFVATENDSVYALDIASGAVAWRVHIGTPVPGTRLPCGDVNPVGITSTPAIDPAHGMLYAVAFEEPGKDVLVALHIDTGAVAWQRPIDPPSDSPLALNQRGALALANGTVYVPFGGRDGDCSLYHGWVVGSSTNGTGNLLTYRVPTQGGGGRRNGGGGIWAPAGIAVDATGSLFVATGNGGSTAFDYSDSVIKLSPTLQVLDYFAPTNWQALSRSDLDLGSVAPVLLDNGLLFSVGKQGVGYLLHADHLGHIGGQAFAGAVCNGSGAFGATAAAAPFLYVTCTNGLVALRVGSGPSFAIAWRGPAVQAGAAVVAGGVVWSVDRGGTLYGLNATTGGVRFQASVGAFSTSFPSLAAVGARLFVPAGDRMVAFSIG